MTSSITLTPGQQAALTQLLASIKAGQNCSLQGPAGTGKTVLVGVLIEHLQHQDKSLLAAAPTHKALGVLRSRIPDQVDACTVASLLGLKPRQRGNWIEYVPDWNQARQRGRLRGVDVLLVDEASMVSEALGSDLVRLAAENNTVLVMIGDQAQLPPVDPPPPDGVDEANHRGVMSAAFLAPPGAVARLSEIVRHQGPVLELATQIRQTTTIQEIHKVWPNRNLIDDQSRVIVYRWPNHWMAAAQRTLCDPRWEASPNSARIICWSNRACRIASDSIRSARYGTDATLWQVGEIVGNGDAIQRPGESLSPPLAPSSYEWRIIGAEQIQLAENFGTFVWFTPKRKDRREFQIACDLPAQRLTLEPLDPDGSVSTIQVNVPLPGDDTWRMDLSELKKEIAKVDPATRNKAWSAWHNLGSLCADIRSAGVLTVHRAQGSTFGHVWVSNDLAFCASADAVPLHYTALTRASKAVHIVERRPDHWAVAEHQKLKSGP